MHLCSLKLIDFHLCCIYFADFLTENFHFALFVILLGGSPIVDT